VWDDCTVPGKGVVGGIPTSMKWVGTEDGCRKYGYKLQAPVAGDRMCVLETTGGERLEAVLESMQGVKFGHPMDLTLRFQAFLPFLHLTLADNGYAKAKLLDQVSDCREPNCNVALQALMAFSLE
jgi:hypothetical protein